jgi:hypothetical protein
LELELVLVLVGVTRLLVEAPMAVVLSVGAVEAVVELVLALELELISAGTSLSKGAHNLIRLW